MLGENSQLSVTGLAQAVTQNGNTWVLRNFSNSFLPPFPAQLFSFYRHRPNLPVIDFAGNLNLLLFSIFYQINGLQRLRKAYILHLDRGKQTILVFRRSRQLSQKLKKFPAKSLTGQVARCRIENYKLVKMVTHIEMCPLRSFTNPEISSVAEIAAFAARPGKLISLQSQMFTDRART